MKDEKFLSLPSRKFVGKITIRKKVKQHGKTVGGKEKGDFGSSAGAEKVLY